MLLLVLLILFNIGLYDFPNLVLLHQLVHSLDVGAHEAVARVGRHVLSHEVVHLLHGLGGLLSQQPHSLAGGEQLDGNDVLDVLGDLERLARAESSHGHVVLLSGGSGDGVHGSGVGEHLVLAHQRSSAAVRDHEARVQTAALLLGEEGVQAAQRGVHQTLNAALRDVGDLVDGDGQVVQRLGGVLAMEVASGDDHGLAVIVAEDHGVVGRAVQLRGQDASHERQRVVHNAVHLRRAAQRVGVLHLLLVGQLLEDLARVQRVVQARAHALRHGALASVLARVVDEVAVRRRRAAQRLERHAADHIGLQSGVLSAHQRLRAQRGDELRAVDERQTLLRTQVHGGQTVLRHQLRSRLDLVVGRVPRLAFTDQTQTQVRQRGQIARSADGSLQGNRRHNARVEEVCIE